MTYVTYLGPSKAVRVGGARIARGECGEVPAEVAKSLLEQSDAFKKTTKADIDKAKAAAKKADEADPTPEPAKDDDR